MRNLKSPCFDNQLKELKKKYPLVEKDFLLCIGDFNIKNGDDLGRGFYKVRLKNSSVPTGKRGGFRMIVFCEGDCCIPILIYSKSDKENVSLTEIKESFRRILKELG